MTIIAETEKLVRTKEFDKECAGPWEPDIITILAGIGMTRAGQH